MITARTARHIRLSVIIPCLNGAQTIQQQLEALASQVWSEPWEVIVSDNGSTDDTRSIVQRYSNHLECLRVVDASDKRGQPHALNVGVLAAQGEAVAFCDDDDEVARGWLAAMGEALHHHDFVACATETEKLNPTRHKRGPNPQAHGLQRGTYPPYLPHAGGGTLGVKRSLHLAIGGFDESLPYHHDTDYCWKLQRAGVPLYFVSDAVTHVRRRRSMMGEYSQARNWAEYNVLLYKRYQPLGMPRLHWKQGVAAWLNLVKTLGWQARRPETRRVWVWKLGTCVGHLKGSVKHRVMAI